MTPVVSGEVLRQTMRCVPSSVVVVTAARPGETRGITIGSFASVSLTPPLISFNVFDDCLMYPVINAVDQFNVHVLSDHQADVSRKFAEPGLAGAEQFTAVPYTLDASGIPVLSDVVALLSCDVYALHPTGDHVLVIGRVRTARFDELRQPLVYQNRSYHRMGDRIASQVWPL